jgi:hypothetical protein
MWTRYGPKSPGCKRGWIWDVLGPKPFSGVVLTQENALKREAVEG